MKTSRLKQPQRPHDLWAVRRQRYEVGRTGRGHVAWLAGAWSAAPEGCRLEPWSGHRGEAAQRRFSLPGTFVSPSLSSSLSL